MQLNSGVRPIIWARAEPRLGTGYGLTPVVARRLAITLAEGTAKPEHEVDTLLYSPDATSERGLNSLNVEVALLDGILVGVRMEVLGHPNSHRIDPSREDGRTHRERYWSPTVLIRGGIAVVWAPYEYWIDGETSHCGVDVFNFVKIDGAWRVSNSMWTVEPNACAELRPAEASQIRPAN